MDAELEESRRAVQLLGGKIERIERLVLPDGSRRTIICIKKISQTSTKYPRPHAKMAKNPLACRTRRADFAFFCDRNFWKSGIFRGTI